MMIFSNVGFMGIPVISALYGSGVIIYIVFYMLGYNFLLYTYGIILARRSAQRNSQRSEKENGENNTVSFKDNIKSIMNPGVVAGTFAIVLL